MQKRGVFAAMPFWALGLIAVALGLCGVGGLFGFVALTSDEPSSGGRPGQATTGPCRLAMPGSQGRVPLFEAEADFDAWAKASGAGDTGEAERIGRRSGFLVESGTTCTVIGGTFVGKRRVRVDSGAQRGRTGWVATEWSGE